jgi:hypothetical protein
MARLAPNVELRYLPEWEQLLFLNGARCTPYQTFEW